jgi:hypothetical protein
MFNYGDILNYGNKIVYFNSPCKISVKKKLNHLPVKNFFLNSQTPKLRFFVLCFGFNQ